MSEGEDLLRNKDAQEYLPAQLVTIELQPDYTQRARCQAKQRQAILWREALFDLVIE